MKRSIVCVILGCGILARLGVWLVNPPDNSYDDHLEVVAYYATEKHRPPIDDCWQCYQPPLYYILAAAVLKSSHALFANDWVAWKSVQLIGTLASILTLIVCWRILERLCGDVAPLALSAVAFLPRDLYTCAAISNDSLLVLWVTLSIWGFVSFCQTKRPGDRRRAMICLAFGAVFAAWTKQSGLIIGVLPLWLIVGAAHRRLTKQTAGSLTRCEALVFVAVMFLMPMDEGWRSLEAHRFMASNQDLLGEPVYQEPGKLTEVSFVDFRLPQLLVEPRLSSRTVSSFWTELFARVYFDYEPRYLPSTATTRWLARALYLVGLVLGVILLVGAIRSLALKHDRAIYRAMLMILVGFVLAPLIQTLRFPYFSSMKAVFVLPAVSVACVLIALGAKALESYSATRWAVLITVWTWCIVGSLHAIAVLIYVHKGLVDLSGPLWGVPSVN